MAEMIHIDDVESTNFFDKDFWVAAWEQSENWTESYFIRQFGTVRGEKLFRLFSEKYNKDVLKFLIAECAVNETITLLSLSEHRDFFKMTEYYDDRTDAYECPACNIISGNIGETEDGLKQCKTCGYVAGDVPETPACIIL